MKKLIIGAAVAVTFTSAFAAIASFTGRQEYITTVTGQSAFRCEYDYAGTRFWRIYKFTCPASVEVE